MENKIKLIIVDDEGEIGELMESHFKRRGYDVLTANSGERAIALTKESNPQLMLLDKRMPVMDGIQTLEAIRAFNQVIKVIMISGDEIDAEMDSAMKKLNITGYLHKPIVVPDLDALVEKMSLDSINEAQNGHC